MGISSRTTRDVVRSTIASNVIAVPFTLSTSIVYAIPYNDFKSICARDTGPTPSCPRVGREWNASSRYAPQFTRSRVLEHVSDSRSCAIASPPGPWPEPLEPRPLPARDRPRVPNISSSCSSPAALATRLSVITLSVREDSCRATARWALFLRRAEDPQTGARRAPVPASSRWPANGCALSA